MKTQLRDLYGTPRCIRDATVQSIIGRCHQSIGWRWPKWFTGRPECIKTSPEMKFQHGALKIFRGVVWTFREPSPETSVVWCELKLKFKSFQVIFSVCHHSIIRTDSSKFVTRDSMLPPMGGLRFTHDVTKGFPWTLFVFEQFPWTFTNPNTGKMSFRRNGLPKVAKRSLYISHAIPSACGKNNSCSPVPQAQREKKEREMASPKNEAENGASKRASSSQILPPLRRGAVLKRILKSLVCALLRNAACGVKE